MPEEINRVVTDQIADLLYTTERGAHDNLAREGIAADAGALRRQPDDRFAARGAGAGRAAARRRWPPRASPAGTGVATARASASSRCTGRPTSMIRRSLAELLDILRRGQRATAAGLADASAHARQHRSSRARRRGSPARASPACRRRAISRWSACSPGAPRADRFRRRAGGDHRAGRAVPDDAAEHRAADHRRAGHQPLVPRDAGVVLAPVDDILATGGKRGRMPELLGRPGRRAHREPSRRLARGSSCAGMRAEAVDMNAP